MELVPLYLYIWASKHILKFAGTASRMKQIELWDSIKCRCCRDYDKTDTFHIFEYSNKLITLEKEEVFDYIFNKLKKYNAEDSVKEMLLQVLAGNTV